MNPLDRLIHAFSKLPGIGQKGATRLAFHVVRTPTEYARELADALLAVKQGLRYCTQCLVPAATDPCAICSDQRRDRDRICVVEEPADLTAIEKSGAYRGLYHILHGCLSPLEGVGPDALKIRELVARLQTQPVEEIILATNTTVEGEATATFVTQILRPLGMRITRLASGMPAGSEVEYLDMRTLTHALEARREV